MSMRRDAGIVGVGLTLLLAAGFPVSAQSTPMAEGIPMGDKLSGLRSLVVSMDYRENAFKGEIICSGADPQANAAAYSLNTSL